MVFRKAGDWEPEADNGWGAPTGQGSSAYLVFVRTITDDLKCPSLIMGMDLVGFVRGHLFEEPGEFLMGLDEGMKG